MLSIPAISAEAERVPAISAEAERVLSSAGFILNSKQRRLREEILKAMLCLAH